MTTGVAGKTEERFEKTGLQSELLDKVQERDRGRAHMRSPSFLDIVLGRERGQKKVHEGVASPG